ncbi:ABC transporter ATP-binding protein [Scopulibacillus cellulosilyticus]|uniref:ABC transporter ATP-binding protein n=1 Tax=Scopulibacillus cellulosilyticus TaxID=2665665 RepID=A0ABW2Q5B2_9BACL
MKVLSFLKPYRTSIIIALFFMLIELIVELVQPLFMAKVIDDGIMVKNLLNVVKWGGLMLGISLIAFFSGIINSFYASHTSQSFSYDVRIHLFKKIQSFSFEDINQFESASLMTRLTNDVTQIQNTVFMSLRIMLRAPLLVVGGTILALIVNAKLGFLLAVVIPFLIVFLWRAMKKGGQLFNSVQKKLDDVNSIMRENLAGIRLIKALIRKNHELKRFAKRSEDLKKRTVSALRLSETTRPIIMLVMNLTLLGILWFGHMLVARGGIKVGDVVAIVNYATRITTAFSPLSFIMMGLSRAKASAQRISNVLEATSDSADVKRPSSLPHVIEGEVTFDQVSFHYPGSNHQVISNLSFTALPGQTVAILGATGSGKSSLVQLIPRLYDIDSGAIFIDNIDIRELELNDLRSQIGFVPQNVFLFTGTVKENIAWGREGASMEQIIKAAKAARIHETICGLPKQYDTVLGQKGINLSGGQKQRLSIARALVRQPKILILDDSTSALDLKTERNFLQALKDYDCTTFIITQKISTAMEADQILLLQEGELLAKGTHDTLIKNVPLYQQIFQSQFGRKSGTC